MDQVDQDGVPRLFSIDVVGRAKWVQFARKGILTKH